MFHGGPSTFDQAERRFSRLKIGAFALIGHLLCNLGIILIAALSSDGPAGPIYAALLFLLSMALLGGGLGTMAKGLTQWHLACLPEDSAPTAPTPAQVLIRQWLNGLLVATALLVVFLGACYATGAADVYAMVAVPFLIGTIAGWITLFGLLRMPGISRSETRRRDAVWAELPRIKHRRLRRERDNRTGKAVVLLVLPVALIRWLGDMLMVPDTTTRVLMAIAVIAGIAHFIYRTYIAPKSDTST